LSGASLASGVTASSLTSVGTLASLGVSGSITTNNQLGINESGVRSWTLGYAASSGNLTLNSGDSAGILRVNLPMAALSTLAVSGATTLSSTLSMADNVIGRPRFTDYAETYTTPAISSGTLTLNIENGNVFRASLNANITTLTISNPSGTGNACSFTLIFNADGTARTVTWPAAVKWPGGTAPTLTSTASRSDMFVFYTNTAGTTWYAMTAAQNFVTA
jgi:hypothetical protein